MQWRSKSSALVNHSDFSRACCPTNRRHKSKTKEPSPAPKPHLLGDPTPDRQARESIVLRQLPREFPREREHHRPANAGVPTEHQLVTQLHSPPLTGCA